MARYYLLAGYLIPIFIDGGSIGPISSTSNGPGSGQHSSQKSKLSFYKRQGAIPRNCSLIKLTPNLKLTVVYYNVDVGHLLIKAGSRTEAYSVANSIRGILGTFFGFMPDDRCGIYYLQELSKIPQPTWTVADFLNALQEINPNANEFWVSEISSGYIIDQYRFEWLLSYVKVAYQYPDIWEAMDNLLESRMLFSGYTTGSYYLAHYSRDRRATSRREMEKRYLENRYRYETAFLAAFKGIERYFKNSNFNKFQIRSLFSNVSYKNVGADIKFTRFHEIFLGLSKSTIYAELIAHFLSIRNIVAAHGNRKPPKNFCISEDNVFEIQKFLTELIAKAFNTYV